MRTEDSQLQKNSYVEVAILGSHPQPCLSFLITTCIALRAFVLETYYWMSMISIQIRVLQIKDIERIEILNRNPQQQKSINWFNNRVFGNWGFHKRIIVFDILSKRYSTWIVWIQFWRNHLLDIDILK